MTVTETEAPSEVDRAEGTLVPPAEPRGFAAVLGTGDHKIIGRLWVFTSFVYLLVAGVSGAALGVERVDISGLGVLDAEVFAQTFSLHAVTGTFLFLLPLIVGLGTYLVPLQVGSSTVAFPRAAAAAYWTYLVAGGIALAAFLADGGPFGGDADAVELFIAAFVAVLAALTLGAICVATTGIAMRARGMGLHRVPLFTWSSIVTGVLVVLTLPLLAGVMILVFIDHRYGPTLLDGSGQVLTRIAWAWSQPSVYLFAIPLLGIVGDIVPVAARTRITLHRVAMGCIGGVALFAFGAWAMPGFTVDPSQAPPLEFVGDVPFYAFAILVLLPAVAFTALLADTLRRGSIRLMSPLVWALAALLMLLAGIANGILVAIEPFDLVGTTAQTAQTHYVAGAALLGLFAGLAYWSAKIFGRRAAEGPSTGLAVLGLIGTVALCLPDLVSGILGQGWRFAGASDDVGAIEALNVVSVVGGGLLVVVAVAFVGLMLVTGAAGEAAVDDPWEGHTLEWATSSPPARGNFDTTPEVSSEAPLYDARYRPDADSTSDSDNEVS